MSVSTRGKGKTVTRPASAAGRLSGAVAAAGAVTTQARFGGRGLQSSTSQLNLSHA